MYKPLLPKRCSTPYCGSVPQAGTIRFVWCFSHVLRGSGKYC